MDKDQDIINEISNVLDVMEALPCKIIVKQHRDLLNFAI